MEWIGNENENRLLGIQFMFINIYNCISKIVRLRTNSNSTYNPKENNENNENNWGKKNQKNKNINNNCISYNEF